MISSFRLRLALSSALWSGLALATFAFSALWLIGSVRVEHVERVIASDAEREAGRPPKPDGWERIERDFVANLGVADANELVLLVQDGAGRTIYRSGHWPPNLEISGMLWPTPAERRPRAADPASPGPRPVTRIEERMINGQAWRFGLAASDRARVAVGVDLHALDDEMQSIRQAFTVAVPVALLLIGLGAWWSSGRALRPIEKLTLATRRITADRLDQRIPSAGEDREFIGLIDVFNGMLGRLERSFGQAHRFSADAAHELKTPLAILQGQLERAINNAEAGSALQKELTGILDEVRRLSTISRKLLLLSRADAGRMALSREPCPLSEILANLVEDMHMLAPKLEVTAEIEPKLSINADSSLLQQLLHNLISNAIKYNVDDGWIRLTARRSAQLTEICVANASTGIAPSERDKIFERFFRADPAHNRKVEGVGLGLALAREIARAHRGDLSFRVADDNSVEFTLVLPDDEAGSGAASGA